MERIKPRRIIVHHSADRSTGSQFANIDAYHKSRGFPRSSLGFYVGYHYVIEHNGTIRQARVDDEIGAHDTGENLNSVGICLTGNFSIDDPTTAQKLSYAQLVHELRQQWAIPIIHIEPHRWDDKTECPGTRLLDEAFIYMYLDYVGLPGLLATSNMLKENALL